MLSVLKKVNLIIASVMLLSICVFAQDPNTTIQGQDKQGKQALIESAAQELTDNLAVKINLTDDQKQSIKDAIYKYQVSIVGVTPESDAQKDAAGTESEAGSLEQGTGTEKGTVGTEEGTTGTEQGMQGTEQGTQGTEQGVADESMGTESSQASKMPQGDMDQWLNSEIENILQDNQKAQWEVAKADFWNQIRDKVSTLQQNSNKMY